MIASRPDLSMRRAQPEIMDRFDIDPVEHEAALAGLRRINALSGSAGAIWRAIKRELPYDGIVELGDIAAASRPPMTVLDVASGGGEIAIALWRRASAAGVPLRIDGIDRHHGAVAMANSRAASAGAETAVRFLEAEALGGDWPRERYDIIICSLFLHHLREERDVVSLLRRMVAAARLLIVVDDLQRSRAGYTLAQLGTRALSRSSIVRHDGPISVEAAFTMRELRAMAVTAGLSEASIHSHVPFRMILTWRARRPSRRGRVENSPGDEIVAETREASPTA